MRYINADELDELKDALRYEIEPAPNHRGSSGYVCPCCHSGKKQHRTGAVKMFTYHGRPAWHCFSCGQWGDVFNYVQYKYGLTSREALEYVADRYSMGDSLRPSDRQAPRAETSTPTPTPPAMLHDEQSSPAPLKDYTAYLQTCKEKLQGSDGEEYLLRRGFTRATMERAGLGYDARKKAVVIPYPGTGYWVARDITGKRENRYISPKHEDAGEKPLYGKLVGETLFVTEGELDAIAFQQAGFAAVGMGGKYGGTLIKALVQCRAQGGNIPVMVIALDNDETGRAGTIELMRQLEALGITATAADTGRLYLGRKDAGEALATSPDEFAEAVRNYSNRE